MEEYIQSTVCSGVKRHLAKFGWDVGHIEICVRCKTPAMHEEECRFRGVLTHYNP